jgi:hypothetical protein
MFRVVLCAIAVASSMLVPPGAEAEGTAEVFGRTYVRETGKPQVRTDTFSAAAGAYSLRVESDRVASAIITLNGATVVTTSDFNANVTLIQRPVTLAEHEHDPGRAARQAGQPAPREHPSRRAIRTHDSRQRRSARERGRMAQRGRPRHLCLHRGWRGRRRRR